MKHTYPRYIGDTPLNRKRFNPSGIRKNSTGQARQAKENENYSPYGIMLCTRLGAEARLKSLILFHRVNN
ncbi:MAG: hypothetical protein KAW92_02495 [Candidatus Cloacimonetes bacterium]|nr:hypothetical protein [Candidatus Cloacimonadota bacterium]